MIARWIVYAFGLLLVMMAVSATVLGQLYDQTQLCKRGSFVAESGCREGGNPVGRNPLARWHLEWFGRGAPEPKEFEYTVENPPA